MGSKNLVLGPIVDELGMAFKLRKAIPTKESNSNFTLQLRTRTLHMTHTSHYDHVNVNFDFGTI